MSMNIQMNEICDFLKEAFCVEGKVELDRFSIYTPKDLKKKVGGAVFKVTDKKRGVFYIGQFRDPS